MKKLTTFFSYAVTALAACAVTLLLVSGHVSGTSKLDQIEALKEDLNFETIYATRAGSSTDDVLAAACDMAFVIMQRYNRPRLIKLMELQKRKAPTEE